MSRNTQGRTFFDSGRNRYIEIILLVDFTAPATGFTGFIDEDPLAVANRANGYLLKTDRALVLGFLAGSYLLAAAVALAAGARLAAFFRAAALAIPARDRAVEVDCFFTARIDLFQRDGEADFEVTAPDRASGTTVPTEKVAEQTASTEIEAESGVTEYVAEIDIGKQIFSGKISHTCETTRVVIGSFFRVRKNSVSLGNFLEMRLGLRCLVAIRVIFHRQLAEPVFYRFRICVTRYTKNLVVITPFTGHESIQRVSV